MFNQNFVFLLNGIKVAAFALYGIKIRIFLVSDLKAKKLIKEQTYMKTEICKLYSRVF